VGDLISKGPSDGTFLREHGAKPLTYGTLLPFIRGNVDVRLLGVESPDDVVLYAIPP